MYMCRFDRQKLSKNSYIRQSCHVPFSRFFAYPPTTDLAFDLCVSTLMVKKSKLCFAKPLVPPANSRAFCTQYLRSALVMYFSQIALNQVWQIFLCFSPPPAPKYRWLKNWKGKKKKDCRSTYDTIWTDYRITSIDLAEKECYHKNQVEKIITSSSCPKHPMLRAVLSGVLSFNTLPWKFKNQVRIGHT